MPHRSVLEHAPVVLKKATVLAWLAVSMASWTGSGTAETAAPGAGGIDFGTAEKLNAEGFLERCEGAVGVAEFVNVQRDNDRRSATRAACVAGTCKEPLASVLDKSFLGEFFAEHCCYRTGAILYVSFFEGADKHPEWVYLASRRLSATELRAVCLGPSDR